MELKFNDSNQNIADSLNKRMTIDGSSAICRTICINGVWSVVWAPYKPMVIIVSVFAILHSSYFIDYTPIQWIVRPAIEPFNRILHSLRLMTFSVAKRNKKQILIDDVIAHSQVLFIPQTQSQAAPSHLATDWRNTRQSIICTNDRITS